LVITRAAIIETLFNRQYIIRDKKTLIPTEKGLAVYNLVKDKKIADVEMTGLWENTLSKIESGETNPETFSKTIEIYATQITTELLETVVSFENENDCICPKCKKEKVVFYSKVVKCKDSNCGLVIFRNKSEKQLSDKQIIELLANGKTSVIKGFKSKNGKAFDALLKFDENFQVVFEFPVTNKKKRN
jgi:DNA topoisomerase-3